MAEIASDQERLIKSTERVRDLGEVFTPANIVNDMLDLLPNDIWSPHPAKTFLEPACGDGNFLVAILRRKLDAIETFSKKKKYDIGILALEALSSIYAVDISPENILGGHPDHPIGARDRLLTIFQDWAQNNTGNLPDEAITVANWILEHNILVGNMLEFDELGKPTNRDQMQFIEYKWDPAELSVEVLTTTYGDIRQAAIESNTDSPSLFGAPESVSVFHGNYLDLGKLELKKKRKKRG